MIANLSARLCVYRLNVNVYEAILWRFFQCLLQNDPFNKCFLSKIHTPYKKGLVLCRSPCQIETYLPGLSEWLLVQYQTKTKILFATPKADPVMFYNRKTTIIF